MQSHSSYHPHRVLEYLRALLHPKYDGPLQLRWRHTGQPLGNPGDGYLEMMLQRTDPPKSWHGMQTQEHRDATRERMSFMMDRLTDYFMKGGSQAGASVWPKRDKR